MRGIKAKAPGAGMQRLLDTRIRQRGKILMICPRQEVNTEEGGRGAQTKVV